MSEYYQNKESKKIEKELNDARKECGLEDFLPECEIWFKKPSVNQIKKTGEKVNAK